jgi:hypothetical protein
MQMLFSSAFFFFNKNTFSRNHTFITVSIFYNDGVQISTNSGLVVGAHGPGPAGLERSGTLAVKPAPMSGTAKLLTDNGILHPDEDSERRPRTQMGIEFGLSNEHGRRGGTAGGENGCKILLPSQNKCNSRIPKVFQKNATLIN